MIYWVKTRGSRPYALTKNYNTTKWTAHIYMYVSSKVTKCAPSSAISVASVREFLLVCTPMILYYSNT